MLSHNYSLSSVILNRVDVIRDLGVLLDAKLSFNHHIERTINHTINMPISLYSRQFVRLNNMPVMGSSPK